MSMSASEFVEVTDLTAFRSGDDDAILGQVQSALRSYFGWHVAPSITETIILDGKGSNHLWLPSLYVTAVNEVINEGTTLDPDDYDWSQSGYLELRSGCWSRRPRQVSVTLTHGYDFPPADIVGVAVAMAARAASSPSGKTREQAGPYSVTWATVASGVSGGLALMQHERVILDHYKLPPRP